MSKATGVSFRPTADRRVRIFHNGRLAATLARAAAAKFLEKAPAAGEEELQLLMPRATGKYQHGNE